MIVNSTNDGWEIIYQRSHALLATILVAAWREDEHVERWTEVLAAITQHDDQEMFWDGANHLNELGAPRDFTVGDGEEKKDDASRVINHAYRQGLGVALLISRHNSFLYEARRGESAILDEFLDKQRANQQMWQEQLGYDDEYVDQAYSFVRWGDRLSLILCQQQIPDKSRWLDVAPNFDGKMVRLKQRDDDTLLLDPWVFKNDELVVSIETRRLHQLHFDNEEDFKQALDKAEIQPKEWHFKKEPDN